MPALQSNGIKSGLRGGLSIVSLILQLMVPLGAAGAETYIHFDVAGAADTWPFALNDNGVIAGTWWDSGDASHGFVRAADGTITAFDPPDDSFGLEVSGISSDGTVAGSYNDGVEWHGFVRATSGAITTFDVNGLYTSANGINSADTVVGYYRDNSGMHAFVRPANGAISTFDAPKSSGTAAWSINGSGDIAGSYLDKYSEPHGFIRSADGGFTTFDIPNADVQSITPAGGINLSDEVAGWWTDSNGIEHAFLRDSSGKVFNLKLGRNHWSFASSMTEEGEVAGSFGKPLGGSPGITARHGFLRAPDGQLTQVDYPNSGGTEVFGINNSGEAAGSYYRHGHFHGFLRTP